MASRILLSWLLLLGSFSACAAQTAPLKLAANEGLPVQWVAELVLREIYQRAGLQMSVEPLPPSRASLLTVAGQKDGEVARVGSYQQQFPGLLRVEPAYYAITTAVYARSSMDRRFQTAEDLLPYRVAIIRGVTHAEQATRNHPALTEVASADRLFKMLAAQRVDVVLDTGLNGGLTLETGTYPDIKQQGVIARLELYHYLHPRHSSLASHIGRIISQLKASGELEKLVAAAEKEVRSRGLPR
jgi:polar amino acid transport system substrate-binding protein